MLAEQLIYIIIAFALFVYIFYQLIKKNDTKYVRILAIQALGIAIDFVKLYFSDDGIDTITRVIIYTLSIIVPVLVIVIEKLNSNVSEMIDSLIARIYLVFGNTKAAKNCLIKLVTKNSQSYIGHKLLAQIYEKEGGQRKAVDEYIQVIDINKQDYDSYYKVATLLNDLDKKDEAIEMLTNLLNKKPDYSQATIDLGDLLIEKQMYKEAVNIYLEALKYNPVSYDLYYNLGIVYTMLNDFKSAKEYYEKAAEINALCFNSKYSLAELELLYKNIEKAEEYFIQVSENEEYEADCYFELAKINLIKGDKETAIRYANMAIDIDAKKISEKIKKEPLFMTIMTKIAIPFNMEEKECMPSLSKKEKLAKKHLEETSELTANMGYEKTIRKEEKQRDEIDRQKE